MAILGIIGFIMLLVIATVILVLLGAALLDFLLSSPVGWVLLFAAFLVGSQASGSQAAQAVLGIFLGVCLLGVVGLLIYGIMYPRQPQKLGAGEGVEPPTSSS